jgi:hypothetical protein
VESTGRSVARVWTLTRCCSSGSSMSSITYGKLDLRSVLICEDFYKLEAGSRLHSCILRILARPSATTISNDPITSLTTSPCSAFWLGPRQRRFLTLDVFTTLLTFLRFLRPTLKVGSLDRKARVACAATLFTSCPFFAAVLSCFSSLELDLIPNKMIHLSYACESEKSPFQRVTSRET